MKASIYTEYGSPDVLSIQNWEKPVPKDKELLIRIYATTVNRTDMAMLLGKPLIMQLFTGFSKPKNPILGTDFAGQVEEVGNKVSNFKVGDRVFGFDDTGLSSHAQYMVMHEDKSLAIIPEGISFQQAAASLEGAHYAYNFINMINHQPGQKVLVNGGTGAIGSAAIQLLKFYGLEVTAVGLHPHLETMKSLGADRVIDYLQEDFTQIGEKFHYVFDAVGKSSFKKCRPLLLKGGIYISSELGKNSQNPFLALITPLSSKLPGKHAGKKVIFPIPFDTKRSVLLIKGWLEQGKFHPLIDRTYPFTQISDAFRHVGTGQKIGNVVVDWT